MVENINSNTHRPDNLKTNTNSVLSSDVSDLDSLVWIKNIEKAKGNFFSRFLNGIRQIGSCFSRSVIDQVAVVEPHKGIDFEHGPNRQWIDPTLLERHEIQKAFKYDSSIWSDPFNYVFDPNGLRLSSSEEKANPFFDFTVEGSSENNLPHVKPRNQVFILKQKDGSLAIAKSVPLDSLGKQEARHTLLATGTRNPKVVKIKKVIIDKYQHKIHIIQDFAKGAIGHGRFTADTSPDHDEIYVPSENGRKAVAFFPTVNTKVGDRHPDNYSTAYQPDSDGVRRRVHFDLETASFEINGGNFFQKHHDLHKEIKDFEQDNLKPTKK